jgi:hypothetical protein
VGSSPSLSLRLGLRREVVVLLPVALFLLILLSLYTLFSYRAGVKLLIEERRLEAARLAQRLAASLVSGPLPSAEALRLQASGASRVALVNERGGAVVESGSFPASDLLAPFPVGSLDAAQGVGPGGPLPESVAGLAPMTRNRQRLYVRVDLRQHQLAAQWRALRILTWLVVLVNLGVAAMLVFFLRYLMAPYESLLGRARRAQPALEVPDDEVSFLVETFERALGALNRPAEAGEDDLAALQRTLGPSLESAARCARADRVRRARRSAGATRGGREHDPGGGPRRHLGRTAARDRDPARRRAPHGGSDRSPVAPR